MGSSVVSRTCGVASSNLWISDVEKKHPEIAYENAINSMIEKYTPAQARDRRDHPPPRGHHERLAPGSRRELAQVEADLRPRSTEPARPRPRPHPEEERARGGGRRASRPTSTTAVKDADSREGVARPGPGRDQEAARPRRTTCSRRWQSAEARIRIQEQLDGLSVDAEVKALENVREHIKNTIAEANLGKELGESVLDTGSRRCARRPARSTLEVRVESACATPARQEGRPEDDVMGACGVGRARRPMPTILPTWAEELRRRYLRGEASVFVLHGNVHDLVGSTARLVLGRRVPDSTSLLEKKDIVIRYNLSTGCRFVARRPARSSGARGAAARALARQGAARARATAVHVRTTSGSIVEYAEMLAPAGDAVVLRRRTIALSVVTLHRWSLAPQLEASDNIVILITRDRWRAAPEDRLEPARRGGARSRCRRSTSGARSSKLSTRRSTPRGSTGSPTITAGLKSIQIKSILQPPPPARARTMPSALHVHQDDGRRRREARARKLAAVTQGMSRDEIEHLLGVQAPAPRVARCAKRAHDEITAPHRQAQARDHRARVLRPHRVRRAGARLLGRRRHRRGQEGAARDRRRTSARAAPRACPMGLLFTGPMGTGKTFVAEAFVKESGLTGDQAQELPLEVGRRDRVEPRADPRRGPGDRQRDRHHRRGRSLVRLRAATATATAAPARA